MSKINKYNKRQPLIEQFQAFNLFRKEGMKGWRECSQNILLLSKPTRIDKIPTRRFF